MSRLLGPIDILVLSAVVGGGFWIYTWIGPIITKVKSFFTFFGAGTKKVTERIEKGIIKGEGTKIPGKFSFADIGKFFTGLVK